MAKTFDISPVWQNLAKSGHTAIMKYQNLSDFFESKTI